MLTAHTDVVGSLLRPAELLKAREEVAVGRITQAEFKAIEDMAVDLAITLQEEAGLEVITDHGDEVDAGRNFGRVWAETLSWAMLSIGYVFAAFDRQKRTLHDHLCGTRVIVRRSR